MQIINSRLLFLQLQWHINLLIITEKRVQEKN